MAMAVLYILVGICGFYAALIKKNTYTPNGDEEQEDDDMRESDESSNVNTS